MTELVYLYAAGAVALLLVVAYALHLLHEVRRYDEVVLSTVSKRSSWLTADCITESVRAHIPHAPQWKVNATLERLEKRGLLESDIFEDDGSLMEDPYGRWRRSGPTGAAA